MVKNILFDVPFFFLFFSGYFFPFQALPGSVFLFSTKKQWSKIYECLLVSVGAAFFFLVASRSPFGDKRFDQHTKKTSAGKKRKTKSLKIRQARDERTMARRTVVS